MGDRAVVQLNMVKAVIEAFDDEELVVFGSCALAFYARRDEGPALRTTKDVDIVVVVSRWSVLESKLERPRGPPVRIDETTQII